MKKKLFRCIKARGVDTIVSKRQILGDRSQPEIQSDVST